MRDARRRGQIARSRDVEQAAQLGAVLITLAWFGSVMVRMMATSLRNGLERVATAGAPVDPSELTTIAIRGAAFIAVTAGPIGVVAAVATLATVYVQGGWNVASEALTPHWDRLNPANGIKRLGFQRAGFDLVKMIVAVVALIWVATRIVFSTIEGATQLGRVNPFGSATIAWGHADLLLRRSLIVLAVIAGADYALQRWRLLKSLRMTKQEVKDDMKLTEGNPEIKARLRRAARDMVRKRMLADVPKATVVITNPTHYAVALQYQRATMLAPRIVAKGQNLVAQRIKDVAREHGIPIVENKPLAQALFKGAEIGDTIPADLFGAVAEVLAYLIRLKQVVV